MNEPRILEAATTYWQDFQFIGSREESEVIVQESVNAFKKNAANQGFDPEAIVVKITWPHPTPTKAHVEFDVP